MTGLGGFSVVRDGLLVRKPVEVGARGDSDRTSNDVELVINTREALRVLDRVNDKMRVVLALLADHLNRSQVPGVL